MNYSRCIIIGVRLLSPISSPPPPYLSVCAPYVCSCPLYCSSIILVFLSCSYHTEYT